MHDKAIWVPLAVYHGEMVALAVLTFGVVVLLRRRYGLRRALFTGGVLACLCATGGPFLVPVSDFLRMQLLAWAIFLYAPLYLAAAAVCLRRQSPRVSVGGFLLAAVLLLVAVDAFLIEPRWLEETVFTVPAPGLDHRVRIGLIADIQTDRPGDYEEKVMQRVAALEPDLVLFAGDYLHILGDDHYREGVRKLNAILRRANLHPRLGAFAVHGNVDHPRYWPDIFEGLDVTVVKRSAVFDLGPVVLTTLDLRKSFHPRVRIPGQNKFHVVLGHSPDYSQGLVDADLMLAGHVHGGQVRLPFIGPLMTFSLLSRDRAVGHTEIAPNRHLVVSRGIGMERAGAPRLRFLCRPELTIIDLVPAPKTSDAKGDASHRG